MQINTNKKVVRAFKGKYRFLSNFYECTNGVEFEGDVYPTAENAYQASKVHPSERDRFKHISAYEARKLGRKVHMREGFEKEKVKIMRQILLSKFKRNPELKEKLLATGDMILVEGNTWGDEFWGVNLEKPGEEFKYGYKGENMLGRLLMEIREELKKLSVQ